MKRLVELLVKLYQTGSENINMLALDAWHGVLLHWFSLLRMTIMLMCRDMFR